MSHESTLRTFYTALNEKDASTLDDLLADDVVFHILPNPVLPAGTITGRPSVLKYVKDTMESLEIQQDIDEISVNGDFATVYVASKHTAPDGAEHAIRWADLVRFEGNRVREAVSLFVT